MRHVNFPCELCRHSLPPTAMPKRCPCGGRHAVCILCEMAQNLVEVGGPDTDELRACPDALKVAAAVMAKDALEAAEDDE